MAKASSKDQEKANGIGHHCTEHKMESYSSIHGESAERDGEKHLSYGNEDYPIVRRKPCGHLIVYHFASSGST